MDAKVALVLRRHYGEFKEVQLEKQRVRLIMKRRGPRNPQTRVQHQRYMQVLLQRENAARLRVVRTYGLLNNIQARQGNIPAGP